MGAHLRTFALFALLTGIFVFFGYVIGTVWLGDWVGAALAGAISFMARMFGWNMLLGGGSRDRNGNAITVILALVGMLLAPIAALLVQLAISRSREYKADYSGAKTVGQPLALASALEKLEIANRRRPLTFGSQPSHSLLLVNRFSGRGL